MVEECRYNTTHVSSGHKCGRCNRFGHGILECNNYTKLNLLQPYLKDVLDNDKKCTVYDCMYSKFHTIDAHHCGCCKLRTTHSYRECPENTKNIKCPICRVDNIIKFSQKKIFGLTDKCSICLDNNVEILFPECSHCCICKDCFDKM